MNEYLPVILFLIAAMISWIIGWLIHPLLKSWGLLDVPNQRSSHTQVTLRGGGLGIVLSVWLAGAWVGWLFGTREMLWLFAASVPVALVSLCDDVRSLPVRVRLATHLAAACAVVYALRPLLNSVQFPTAILLFLFVFWVVAYTNAFNFMDGINGMAAFQGVTTGIGTAVIAGLATQEWSHWTTLVPLLIAGAAAGFLPHNFPRARMFMGDVGSVTLGFLLASLVLFVAVKHGLRLLPALLLLHTNFILDTGVTRFRLMLRGGQWYGPHRDHFYQRLNRAGKSHSFVSLTYAAGQLATIFGAAFYVWTDSNQLRIAAVGLVLALWASVFGYCEVKFKALNAQPTS